MSPTEKPRFVLPIDKVPKPAQEGREKQPNGTSSDRRYHEESMATGDSEEDEDLAALRAFIKKNTP